MGTSALISLLSDGFKFTFNRFFYLLTYICIRICFACSYLRFNWCFVSQKDWKTIIQFMSLASLFNWCAFRFFPRIHQQNLKRYLCFRLLHSLNAIFISQRIVNWQRNSFKIAFKHRLCTLHLKKLAKDMKFRLWNFQSVLKHTTEVKFAWILLKYVVVDIRKTEDYNYYNIVLSIVIIL